MINLITNAIDAMAETTHPRIRFYEVVENERIHLHVEDNGCGISKENQQKVFQYGFTTKQDGHGFGLHSCANAMTEIGGNLRIMPQDSGATFVIEVKKA